MNDERTIRSFVAIDLPTALKDRLASLEASLRKGSHPVKWVNPQGLHLTLKFLGAVQASRIPGVAAALENAVRGCRPFTLQASGIGMFPTPSRPRVIWVGLEGEIDALQRLQAAVEAALEPLGFPREQRPLSPHLTLGRVRDDASPDERRALGEMLTSTRVGQLGQFTVQEVILMESKLSPQGARYTPLHRAPLRLIAEEDRDG